MPNKAIADIIAKALSDKEFRRKLIEKPDTALEGYGLTVQEMALIASSLAKDQAAAPAAELDQRVSKARLPLGFLGDFARQYSGADDPPDTRFADQARALRPAGEARSARPAEARASLSAEAAAGLAETSDIDPEHPPTTKPNEGECGVAPGDAPTDPGAA